MAAGTVYAKKVRRAAIKLLPDDNEAAMTTGHR
jgi:hypothetical protein